MTGIRRALVILFILASMPICTSVLCQDAKKPHCPTPEEIDALDIADFRDEYVPKEYYPSHEFMCWVDIGVLVFVLCVGGLIVIKRRPRKELTVLAGVALVYFGIFRGGCICPVGAVSNIVIGCSDPGLVGRATAVLFLVPLVLALLVGRVFCTAGCPLGAIQHLAHKKRKLVRLPLWMRRLSRLAPIAFLVATIWLALSSSCLFVCILDPYKPVFFNGYVWSQQLFAILRGTPMESRLLWACGLGTWIFFLTMIAVGYWIPRPFCRFLCPYGVLLGVISVFSVKRRRIDNSKCTHCTLCQRTCPTEAITIDRDAEKAVLSHYDCIQCNRCSDACKFKAIS